MVIQNSYDINPPAGPPTVVITVNLRAIDRSRSAELRAKLEEVANEWAKDVLGESVAFQLLVKLS